MALPLENLVHTLPLLLGEIDPGGVVGADVHDEDALLLLGLHVLHHPLEVETLGLRIVERHVVVLKVVGGRHVVVDRPGGVSAVELLVAFPVLLDEATEQEESSAP